MYEPRGLRRTHGKSRNGCIECKTRHIKCDEQFPSCSNCTRRKHTCVYKSNTSAKRRESSQESLSSAAPSPSPTLPHLPGYLHLGGPEVAYDVFNMELMHHFSASTCMTLPSYRFTPPSYQMQAPKMGLKDSAVMSAILAISALHIHVLDVGALPQTDYLMLSRRHYRQAREHLQKQPSDEESWFLANHLLSLYCIAVPLDSNPTQPVPYPNFLTTSRPLLFQTIRPWRTKLSQLEEPWRQLFNGNIPASLAISEPPALMQLMRPFPGVSDFQEFPEVSETYGQAIQCLRETLALSSAPDTLCSSVLYWPTMLPDTFVQYVIEGKPRALVILSYWCAFVSRFQDLWWLRRRGEADVFLIQERMTNAGHIEWFPWLEEPLSITRQNRELFDNGAFNSVTV
ncbi:hypothetical protein DL96DRAFT_539268 [Flagelloscypha sp. PMI_526]|nr:hypothetical protein DL96DRAFT_539268 [Flagelloscypha sp. PMI_526]